ncbi:NAD-dependent protein deacetylase [uncultured Porticoccus sp.]|uniref:NAD-dependent protein deacetylase n=1 Tax=uncultured Porticoccus sp. TaxID=1256050 RepID=UPI0030DA3DA9|tara:strand:- start:11370 stop:12263 length:894 start_codon:yes stop_codon:yes gene_type:complete
MAAIGDNRKSGAQSATMTDNNPLQLLTDFVHRYPDLLVLSGAGISASSGVPTYRSSEGHWQRRPPVQHGDFLNNHCTRQRFWARNMVGWRFMRDAHPSPSHFALAGLEALGMIRSVVTQNVDGLHQRAGSRRVIDLHGRIDRVRCLGCDALFHREDIQRWLEQHNQSFAQRVGEVGPDGDAELDDLDYSALQVCECRYCGGVLKPDAVFFGGTVPPQVVADAAAELLRAEALLVVGSSLMVYSGFRFCRWAVAQGKPIAVINPGKTRADALVSLKLALPCDELLPALASCLRASVAG